MEENAKGSIEGLDRKLRRLGPRKWEENSIEEKIEVLRQETLSQRRQLSFMSQKINKLMVHSHQGERIVVPFEESYGAECGQMVDPLA